MHMIEHRDVSLAKKLGVVDGSTVVVLAQPQGLTLQFPTGVVVRRRSIDHADVVLGFFRSKAQLDRRIHDLAGSVFPAGGLWIAWPKRASSIPTDITDHVVRELSLHVGLVDNKVCAIDRDWTGLRLVWRREYR